MFAIFKHWLSFCPNNPMKPYKKELVLPFTGIMLLRLKSDIPMGALWNDSQLHENLGCRILLEAEAEFCHNDE